MVFNVFPHIHMALQRVKTASTSKNLTFFILLCCCCLFQALEHLKPSDNCLVGKATENRDKNRYRDILPCKTFTHLKVKVLFKFLLC